MRTSGTDGRCPFGQTAQKKNAFTYYPTATDTVMALKAGWVDVVCLDEPVAQLAVNTNEGIAILPEVINRVDYGIVFPKGSGR